MIDIHNHLLVGVDDGSKSYEESRELLLKAKEEGITDILVTPHFMKEGPYNHKREELIPLFEELKERNKDIDINLYLGNELLIDYELDELINKNEVLTLNNSNYVLVEFPFEVYLEEYDEYLYNISLNNKIIIAHPERYRYVIKEPEFVSRWLENNYYLQVNQSSLFKPETKKTALKLIEKGYVNIIASDGHNRHRPVVLKDAYEYISHKFNEDIARLLFIDNPRRVIDDELLVKANKVRRRLF